MDWKLEVAFVGVSDIDRARDFYVEKVGFVLDHDVLIDEGVRFVQLTAPGSACSIVFGEGLTGVQPGHSDLMLVVDDVGRARRELRERGLEIGEIDDQPWGRFVYFSDPDGNSGRIQEIPAEYKS